MTRYIIVVQFKLGNETDSVNLEKILSSNFKTQKLTDRSYLILSSNTTVEIRNYLTNNVPSIDQIFIGELGVSAAWRSLYSSSDDIKKMFEDE